MTSSRLSEDASVRTMLIVDDCEETLELCSMIFKANGYCVLTADSAEAALGLLRRGERVDVLVTDYNLPGRDGIELIHEAEREGLLDPRTTPTLICTGAARAPSLENVSVLRKPVDAFRLECAVERAIIEMDKRVA